MSTVDELGVQIIYKGTVRGLVGGHFFVRISPKGYQQEGLSHGRTTLKTQLERFGLQTGHEDFVGLEAGQVVTKTCHGNLIELQINRIGLSHGIVVVVWSGGGYRLGLRRRRRLCNTSLCGSSSSTGSCYY
jgi:hypothetical protein